MKDLKTLITSYSFYKENTSKVPTKDKVDKKTYIEINSKFLKFMIGKVLDGFLIYLPAKLGKLHITGKKIEVKFDENGKPIGLAPDWVNTKKLWERSEKDRKNKTLIYHTNDHSDNIRYKYFWSKKNIIIENKILYSIKLTRANKRAVHGAILEGKEYHVNNFYEK